MTQLLPNGPLIFVLGLPGSGKGTICKRVAQDLGYLHMSVGDYLRSLRAGEQVTDEVADKVKEYLPENKLLPGPDLVRIIKSDRQPPSGSSFDRSRLLELMVQDHSGVHGTMLDGFPRSIEQQEAWSAQCPPPTIVLLIDCPREVAQDRFLSRQSPDRPEGTVEVFVKRASEYEKNNGEIVGRYEKAGVPYAIIDSSKTIEYAVELSKAVILSRVAEVERKGVAGDANQE